MLAADKLQLQSALKQQAVSLKEKEFNLHHSNLMTVGTQAAVLAGLDITMFIEFAPADNNAWGDYSHVARVLKMLYYGIIVAAFGANMIVVSHTTALSVLGAGLALRGPDGSMMTATDGLYEERNSVFRVFGFGMACTVGSVLISVWLLLQWEAALCCWVVSCVTCYKIYTNYRRVTKRFEYDESETVDFRDIMEGPAAIQAVPANYHSKIESYKKKKRQQLSNIKSATNASNGGGGSRFFQRATSVPVVSSSSRLAITGKGSNDSNVIDSSEESFEDSDDVELQQSLLMTHVKRRSTAKKIEPIQMV